MEKTNKELIHLSIDFIVSILYNKKDEIRSIGWQIANLDTRQRATVISILGGAAATGLDMIEEKNQGEKRVREILEISVPTLTRHLNELEQDFIGQ